MTLTTWRSANERNVGNMAAMTTYRDINAYGGANKQRRQPADY